MSFFDHFTSLDSARWGSLTSGSGSVTCTDSYVELNAPAVGDAAAIYYKTKIDTSVSQTIAACVSFRGALTSPIPFWIIDKATDPVAETATNYNPRRIFSVGTSDSVAMVLRYWDSGGSLQKWSTSGTGGSYSTANNYAVNPIVADDYYIVVFEIDGPGSKWRALAYGITAATFGTAKDQGLVLAACTDWTTWANTRSISDGIWLVLGDLDTTNTSGISRVEWVRHSDGTKQYAFLNGKDDGGSYDIRRSWSFDGKFFVPEDRTSTIATGDIKDQWCLDPGAGTVYLFYKDNGTAGFTNNVIVRSASTAGGSFGAPSTLFTAPSGHSFSFPCIVYTPWEAAGYEYQMLLSDNDGTNQDLRLFTCATATGTWTDRGIVLTHGASGDDATFCTGPVILHRNGRYEVWYTGGATVSGKNNVQQTGLLATGPGLTSAGAGLLTLTKDGVGTRLGIQDSVEALTANLTGNTASVASTTGFAVDQPIYFDQDSTQANYVGAKVRKITTNTSIEFYPKATGLLTASSAKVYGAGAGNQQIRNIFRVGSEWWLYMCVFNNEKMDASFGGFQEESMLMILPSGVDLPQMAASYYSWVDSPLVFRHRFGYAHSNENITLVNGATPRTYVSPSVYGGRPARRFTRSF